jgi:hypothetical protein
MNKLNTAKRKIKQFFFQRTIFPDTISQEILVQQAADFFTQSREAVQKAYSEYYQFHIAKQYEALLGERKTLCFEEAFLLYLAVLRNQPVNVVEIGTQYGKSARRILDILQFAGLKCSNLTCFDIFDQVKYFSKDEAILELYDITDNFRDHVLSRLEPGIIFLDARPFKLLYNVISEYLGWSIGKTSILAIHDCSPILYKSRMKVKKEDTSSITSCTGVWERHILSELFHMPNKSLDDLSTETHKMRIFSTPHGLALIMALEKD